MNISFRDKNSNFTVKAPISKSVAHRELIVRFLCGDRNHLSDKANDNDDIRATKACLRALLCAEEGARTGGIPSEVTLMCNESGSTLRFMIPVAAAFLFGQKNYDGLERIIFETKGRLFDRPIKELKEALLPHGITVEQDERLRRILVSGHITPGEYTIDGSVSSQYISGLLMALPLLEKPSTVRISGECTSAPYIGLTEDVLAKYDNPVKHTGSTFEIPAPGYKTAPPDDYSVEGDWSNGAFLLCLRKFTDITVTGLNPESRQGDRAVTEFLKTTEGIDYRKGPADIEQTFDCTNTPDIVPYYASTAPFFFRKTVFTGIGRLRAKESDRLGAILDQLHTFNIRAEEENDCLTVYGCDYYINGSGKATVLPDNIRLSSFHDHRMAMSAVLLTAAFKTEAEIDDIDCLKKSFPEFIDILKNHFA